jgi:diaminopimelate decarboxylase
LHKKHLGFSYKNQILHAESVAITDLMKAYGSPLYVYSRTDIENNWREFDQAFGLISTPNLFSFSPVEM